MKHYKVGEVLVALKADGSQDSAIEADWVAITNAEADAWRERLKPPPADVTVVTMRQARLALLAVDKLSLVNATINSLPSPQREAAQIEWEFASEIRKDSPLITTLAPLVGLSPANVTTLFNTAATL